MTMYRAESTIKVGQSGHKSLKGVLNFCLKVMIIKEYLINAH